MAVSANHNGWRWDKHNGTLDFYYRGTAVGYIASNDMTLLGTLFLPSSAEVNAGTMTLGAGNLKLGSPGAFASTQPIAAVVMGGSSSGGTAPAGAITTSGAVFASDTVVRKIIADGTASNVET